MNKSFFSSGRWKDWFAFSRRERSGIVVLLSILATEAMVLLWLHYVPGSWKPKTDFQAFEKEADAFIASLEKKKQGVPGKKYAPEANEDQVIRPKPFSFNPNTQSAEGWKQLGVPDRLAQTLQKYLAKGGRFRKKEDLRKMYGMSEEEYTRLEPFIVLPAEEKRSLIWKEKAKEKTVERTYETAKIDIGIADTIELTRIRGVGVVFARRINSYRDKLGGFTGTDQLKEVYGMKDTLYREIVSQVTIADTTNIRRLKINSVDYMTLRNHPYIGRDLAGIIVNYRKQHGSFRNTEDLRKIPLVTDELYRKLAPYLSLE